LKCKNTKPIKKSEVNPGFSLSWDLQRFGGEFCKTMPLRMVFCMEFCENLHIKESAVFYCEKLKFETICQYSFDVED